MARQRHKGSKRRGLLEKDRACDASQNLAKLNIQERIQARIRDAQIDTNEIVGTLVSQMRGDFGDILPEDAFIQQVKASGHSHLLKEVEITEKQIPAAEGKPLILERKYKIKIHDAQAAAKQLCNVFGLEKLPAPHPETVRKLDEAVGKFIEKAAARGLKVTPEQAREKLKPYFETGSINN